MLTTTHTRIVDQEPQYVGDWMHAQGSGHYRPGATCIGLERHGILTAGTMYDWYNGVSIFAHIAIAGPITRRWLWFIFFYPFRQLNCTTMIGVIAESNQKARHLVERFGFKLNSVLPDCGPSGTLLLYLLHRDQCQFVRPPYEPIR